MRIRATNQHGFTLIEVTLAVLLVGVAFSILLSLQSAVVDQSVRDRNRERALLAGRQILSQLEASDPPENDYQEEGALTAVMQKVCGDTALKGLPLNEYAQYTATLSLAAWQVPNLRENALRKLQLTIRWSSSPLDVVQITFLVPGPPPT